MPAEVPELDNGSLDGVNPAEYLAIVVRPVAITMALTTCGGSLVAPGSGAGLLAQ